MIRRFLHRPPLLLIPLVLFLAVLTPILVEAASWRRIFRVCETFWEGILASPGTAGVHLLFAALALWVVVRSLACLSRLTLQEWLWRRSLQRAPHTSLPPSLRTSSDLLLVENDAPFALTSGLVHPRTYLSTGLVRRSSKDELTAIVLHEQWHRQHRDPLRYAVWRYFEAILSFLPVIKEVSRSALTAIEEAADARAMSAGAAPGHLLAALRRVVLHDEGRLRSATASFALKADLEHRIHILQGRIVGRRVARAPLFLSLGILLALILTPAVGKPSQAAEMPAINCSTNEGQTAVETPSSGEAWMSQEQETERIVLPPHTPVQRINWERTSR